MLEVFGLVPAAPALPELSATAQRVLGRLEESPAGVDELVRALSLDASAVAAALAELELVSAVSETDGCFRTVTPRRMSS